MLIYLILSNSKDIENYVKLFHGTLCERNQTNFAIRGLTDKGRRLRQKKRGKIKGKQTSAEKMGTTEIQTDKLSKSENGKKIVKYL